MTEKAKEKKNEYMKSYCQNHKEQIAKNKKRWRDKSKEHINEYQREYRSRNKDKVKEYNARYWQQNRDKKRMNEKTNEKRMNEKTNEKRMNEKTNENRPTWYSTGRGLDAMTLEDMLNDVLNAKWDDEFGCSTEGLLDALTECLWITYGYWKVNKIRVDRNTLYKKRDSECCLCGKKENLKVHHIVPVSWGGDNSDLNLITVCHDCHKHIHNPVIMDEDSIKKLLEINRQRLEMQKIKREIEDSKRIEEIGETG